MEYIFRTELARRVAAAVAAQRWRPAMDYFPVRPPAWWVQPQWPGIPSPRSRSRICTTIVRIVTRLFLPCTPPQSPIAEYPHPPSRRLSKRPQPTAASSPSARPPTATLKSPRCVPCCHSFCVLILAIQVVLFGVFRQFFF